MQDTELAKISQAGMPDILQRANWRTAKPKIAAVQTATSTSGLLCQLPLAADIAAFFTAGVAYSAMRIEGIGEVVRCCYLPAHGSYHRTRG